MKYSEGERQNDRYDCPNGEPHTAQREKRRPRGAVPLGLGGEIGLRARGCRAIRLRVLRPRWICHVRRLDGIAARTWA
jgi:hypothetical protein